MTRLLRPALLLLLSGCATIIHGRTQQVMILSTPPGAVVSVDGNERDTTPTIATVSRKNPHTLRVKRAGYAPESLTIVPSSGPGLLLMNTLLFHPVGWAIGLGVDVATGSHRRFPIDQLHFQLLTADSATAYRGGSGGAPRALLPVGARIRVLRLDQAVPATTIGAVRAYGVDTLTVESAPSVLQQIPHTGIESIELSAGLDRSLSARRWAGRGAVVGFLAGVVVGFGIDQSGFGSTLLGGVGAMGGASAGALFGFAIGKDERWVKIR